MSVELRPYQQQVIYDLDQNLAKHRKVLLVSPTGAGKTVIAGRLCEIIRQQGKRVVFCVGRYELLQQTLGVWHQFGLDEDVGVVSAKHTRMTWQPLIVASMQTLVRLSLIHI